MTTKAVVVEAAPPHTHTPTLIPKGHGILALALVLALALALALVLPP